MQVEGTDNADKKRSDGRVPSEMPAGVSEPVDAGGDDQLSASGPEHEKSQIFCLA